MRGVIQGATLGLCGLLGLSAGPTSAGALLDAYHQAQENDAVLQAALYQRDATVEVRPQALAAFLPQLAATAAVQREREYFSGEQSGAVAVVSGGTAPVATGSGDATLFGNASNYGLTLNQTLWSFQAYHQLRESDSQVAAAEAAFRSADQNLILRVAQAYFAILATADQVATNRSEREAYGALLHQSQVRLDTGIGPRSDVEQAQAYYDATEQSVIDAENALDDARRALAEITAHEPDSVAPLKEEIPLAAPTPATPDDWIAQARRDNFDVAASALRAEAARRDIAVQRAKYFPTLAAQAGATRLQQDASFGGDEDVDSVGFSVNWAIFQGGAVQSLVRQAQATWQAAKADLDTAQRTAERATRAAFRGVDTGVARIRAARRAADSSRTAVEASKRNIEFGTGGEFTLLEAQTNYYSAVSAYQQSRYDYLTAVLQLKQQVGRLTVADLATIDGLLLAGAAAGSTAVESAPHSIPEGSPHVP